MFKIEHNVQTGEIIEVPLTEEEIADVLARQEAAKPKVKALEKEIIQTNAKRKLILEKLGITEEEAKLLLS